MSKWIIPRHEPRRTSEEHRKFKNRARVHVAQFDTARDREAKRKAAEVRKLRPMAMHGVDVAKFVLGTCTKKASLTLDRAKVCAKSAAFESCRDISVYECPYCGMYHLTSRPMKGGQYVFVARYRDGKVVSEVK